MLPPISSSWPMPMPIPLSPAGIPPVGIDVLGIGVVRVVRVVRLPPVVRRLVLVRLVEREPPDARAPVRLEPETRERLVDARLPLFWVVFFAPAERLLLRLPDFLALDDRLVGISLLDRKWKSTSVLSLVR